MIEISLGQRIHELRDKADLSLRGLAKRIGISSPFLLDIELGRGFPSEEILAKLALQCPTFPRPFSMNVSRRRCFRARAFPAVDLGEQFGDPKTRQHAVEAASDLFDIGVVLPDRVDRESSLGDQRLGKFTSRG
jgi:transcriptional regulator with XRE-family HTH domain